MTDSSAPAPPPPPTGPFPAAREVRRSMVVQHIIGTVVAFVATPIGILIFDYGTGEYHLKRVTQFENGFHPELIVVALGGLVLMAVAASARLSGLGPVIAGVVWGAIPLLWFIFGPGSFYDFSQDLPGSRFWFNNPLLLFGLLAPLLIGSGLGGRWRGKVVPAVQPWAPEYR